MRSHILLVEPDRKLAGVYCAMLQQYGYQVTTAGHAQDAITAADRRRPDIVLLELQLVGHSGIEFLYELRSYAEWQAIPVVLLTVVGPDALGMTPELMDRLGIVRCLYKPATSHRQLRRMVREVMPVAV